MLIFSVVVRNLTRVNRFGIKCIGEVFVQPRFMNKPSGPIVITPQIFGKRT